MIRRWAPWVALGVVVAVVLAITLWPSGARSDAARASILLAPQDSGLGLIVWILPVLVLGLGTAGVVFALARNRREPRLHATPADEDLIARERAEEA